MDDPGAERILRPRAGSDTGDVKLPEQADTEKNLNCLAGELFTMFARFEYALKAAGFHKGDGAAEPNWRSFAESVTCPSSTSLPTRS